MFKTTTNTVLDYSYVSKRMIDIDSRTFKAISDIKWRKGIERKQIENILKVAVHQAFNYRLCERVTSKTIDILVGNVVELEWE